MNKLDFRLPVRRTEHDSDSTRVLSNDKSNIWNGLLRTVVSAKQSKAKEV